MTRLVGAVIPPAAVAAACAAGGLALATIYMGSALAVAVVAAATASVLVSASLARPAIPASIRLVGSLAGLGLFLIGLAATVGGSPTRIVSALAAGGDALLTAALPIQSTLDTLALPVAAVWLSAAAGFSGVRRGAATTLVPALVLFATAAIVVGPDRSGSREWPAVALLLAAAAVLFGVGRTGTGYAARSRSALVLAVVAVAFAVPLSLAAPGPEPLDVRSMLLRPEYPTGQLSPLARLSGWATDPGQVLFEVSNPDGTDLRWVTLGRFDGISWLPCGPYRAAGASLPGTGGPSREQRVTIRGLTGGWLPASPWPRRVREVRFALEADSATLLAIGGVRPGMQYTVEYGGTGPGPAGEDSLRPYREVPAGVPDAVTGFVRAVAPTAGPEARVRALADRLRQSYRLAAPAPGGEGYLALRYLLSSAVEGTHADAGGSGSAAQFASALAVMTRLVGLPSRLVVGFHAPTGNGIVRAADAYVAVEIYTARTGWLSIDATPPLEGTGGPARPVPYAPSPADPAPTIPPDRPSDSPVTPDLAAPVPADSRSIWPAIGFAAGGVLALGVLGCSVVGAVGRRCRRPRDPALAVVSAWRHVVLGHRLYDRRPGPAVTPTALGLGPLAQLVNAVAFDPAAQVQPEEAAAMLTLASAQHRALRQRANRLRRLLVLLDPRSLYWYAKG